MVISVLLLKVIEISDGYDATHTSLIFQSRDDFGCFHCNILILKRL